MCWQITQNSHCLWIFQTFFFLLSNLDKKTHKEINKFSWPLPFYMYTVIPSIQTNCTFQMLFQSLRAVRKLEVRASPKKKMTYHFNLLCPSSTTWRIEIFIRMSCLPKITFIFFDVVDDNYTLGQNNFVQNTKLNFRSKNRLLFQCGN